MKAKYDLELIKKLAPESNSYRDLSRKIGYPNPTDKFRKFVQNSGIDISHFTKSYPGSTKYKQSIGKEFGYLFIDDIICVKSSLRSNYYAKCTCKCGKKVDVLMSNIRRGATRSCGCFKKDIVKLGVNNPNWNGIGDISGTLFKNLKNSAKNRKLEFDLDKEYLWDLFLKQEKKCAISGVELFFGSVDIKFTRNASLDRIQNDIGYIKGNVQWVHKDINIMKHIHSLSDFIEICKTITEYQFNVKIQEGRCDVSEEKWNPNSVSRF